MVRMFVEAETDKIAVMLSEAESRVEKKKSNIEGQYVW